MVWAGRVPVEEKVSQIDPLTRNNISEAISLLYPVKESFRWQTPTIGKNPLIELLPR